MDLETDRKKTDNFVHAKLDLVYVDGYVPFRAREVDGTLGPCMTRFGLVWCFAVFQHGDGGSEVPLKREVPLETAGYQTFKTEWGLVWIKSDKGLTSDNAVTKSLDLTMSPGEYPSASPKHKKGLCLSVNNANLKCPGFTITLNDAGRTVMRTILPNVYDKELIPLVVLSGNDVSSVITVSSEPSSDDDGHSECSRMGYCEDNYNYFSKARKDSDATVIDVFNTNQNLFLGG